MTALPYKNDSSNRLEGANQAYRTLRSWIFSGYYFPRQRLVESVLCKDLGVNRNVVRDILKNLAAEGLVVTEPFKGCSVADVSMQDAYETYQIQAALEGLAAHLAASHMDKKDVANLRSLIDEANEVDPDDVEQWITYNRRIHRLINTSCGNRKLIDLIRKNVQFSNYWFVVLSTPGEIPKRNQQHLAILRALKAKAARKAQRLVEDHIMEAAESIRGRLDKTLPSPESRRSIAIKVR
jgi:DNA-binding GntR family transcriptional regulator